MKFSFASIAICLALVGMAPRAEAKGIGHLSLHNYKTPHGQLSARGGVHIRQVIILPHHALPRVTATHINMSLHVRSIK